MKARNPVSTGNSGVVTADTINKTNLEFWASQMDPVEPRVTHPGILPLVLEAHQIELRAMREANKHELVKRTAAATVKHVAAGATTRRKVLEMAEKLRTHHGRISMEERAELVSAELLAAKESTKVSAGTALRIFKASGGGRKWGISSVCSSDLKKPC